MLYDDQVGDLLVEWDEAREQGRELSAKELCQEFPDLIEEVQQGIIELRKTDWLEEPIGNDEDDDFLSLPDFSVDLNAETKFPSSTLSIEQFSKAIATSGLMDSEEVESVQQSSTSQDAESLARELINRNKLTEYQAKLLYQGKEDRLVFDNYVILDKIGEGGMGQVYLAEHRRMGRKVALKTLPPTMTQNKQAIRRFHREVQAAAKLSHPNIVAAFDADESNGVHYLVMEHVKGVDLRSLVKKDGPLSVEQAIEFVRQAATGLAYAHSEGITHRDIKPSNVLLSNKGIIKVLDMGLARMDEGSDGRTQTELTQSGAVMGTVDYMSPEQALNSKHADAKSDIYSLGCMLHFLLTGKSVYRGDTVIEKVLAHRDQPIPSIKEIRPETPQRLDALFQKMVAKQPEDRYQTMTAVIKALRTCNVDDPEPAEPESATALDDENYQKFLHVIEVEDTPTIVEPENRKDALSLKQKPFPIGKKQGLLFGTVAALVIGFLGYLYYAQVIKVETPEGTIVIDLNQQDVEIFIDNKQVVTIIDPKDKTKIKVEVEPGKHELKVTKGGFEAYVNNFSLKGLDGKSIKVSLEPKKTKPALAGGPDRLVAEWALKLKNKLNSVSLTIISEGKKRSIQSVEDIPSESFKIIDLKLVGRDIEDKDLEQIGELSDLKIFHLHNNASIDRGLRHLANLPKLQELNLNFTSVSSLGLEHLQNLDGLSSLFLIGCKNVNDQTIQAIKGIPNLKQLYLESTKISEKSMITISQFNNLEVLSLRSLPVTPVWFENWETDTKISNVLLAGSTVDDSVLLAIGKINSITGISILNSQITNDGLEHLSKMKQLLSIGTRGNSLITSEGFIHLSKLPKLQWLRVQEDEISDAALPHFYKLPLKDVILLSTKVTAAGVKAFHKALPNCEIIHESIAGSLGPDRPAAEWVLNKGGSLGVQIWKDGKIDTLPVPVGRLDQIPNERFRIVTLVLGVEFDDKCFDYIEPLSGLSSLSLYRSRITDSGLRRVPQKHLSYLNLIQTGITDSSLQHLRSFTHLGRLELGGTKVTAAGVKSLQKALPNCKIIHESIAGSVDNYALQFDGKDDYVSVPSLKYDGSHPLTIEAFVICEPARERSVETIAGWSMSAKLGLTSYRDTMRHTAMFDAHSPDAPLNAISAKSGILADRNRLHIAGIWDNNRLLLFVDGKRQNITPKLTNITDLAKLPGSDSTNFGIGAPIPQKVKLTVPQHGFLHGIIDEVRISNIARYDKDFTPAKRFETDKNTLALYHFDSGSGDVLKDSSGNGHHGNIVGAKWVRVDDELKVIGGAKPPIAKAPFNAEQAKAHQEAWAKHLGVEVETTNSIGMKLVMIPAGQFQMGSPDSNSAADDDERPQHLVKITKPFYLSVYEVTQQQYEKVMGDRPWQGEQYVREGPDYPATYVNWNDAAEFCRKLSEQEGVEYRLPTEAEWEYACRAGTTTLYSFGNNVSQLKQHAWYDKNAWDIGETYAHRVGQKLPNRWGLYDMHGNVYEWCQDWYGAYGSNKVLSEPMGSAQGESRLLRGGSFDNLPSDVRSAVRSFGRPTTRKRGFGFRPSRTYP